MEANEVPVGDGGLGEAHIICSWMDERYKGMQFVEEGMSIRFPAFIHELILSGRARNALVVVQHPMLELPPSFDHRDALSFQGRTPIPHHRWKCR